MSYNLAELVKGSKRTRRKELRLRPFKTPRHLEALPKQVAFEVLRVFRKAVVADLLDRIEAGQKEAALDDLGGVKGFFDREEAETHGLFIRLGPKITDWAVGVEKWHRRKFVGSVKSGTDIDVETFMLPASRLPQVAAYQDWMSSLITSVTDDVRKQIRGITYQALVDGTPRRKIAKQISDRFEIGRTRALFIVRDQTTKLAGELDRQRNIEAGITRYEWVHSGKANPREEHVARDGKTYSWDDPPEDGNPGDAPGCGCTSKAILDF